MASLRIQLFGCPSIFLGGSGRVRKPGRTAERLLGYLALNGERLHPREKLATLLWQDAGAEQARNALKTTLWRLRKRLEPTNDVRGRYLTVSSGGEIGLNWSQEISCDVTDFQAAVAEQDKTGAVRFERLRKCVLALEGELLEGFYDDWVIAERERLNVARARALGRLMTEASRTGDHQAALDYGRSILDRDPLRESVYREMIRLHLRLGQRVQALRQYETCTSVIRSELGIDPMPETRALRAQIVIAADMPDTQGADPQELQAAMRRVDRAMDQLAKTHAELAQRLHLARRPPGSE